MIRLGSRKRSHSSLTNRCQSLATLLTSLSAQHRPFPFISWSAVVPSFAAPSFSSAPCWPVTTHLPSLSQRHVCERAMPSRRANGLRIRHSSGMLGTALMVPEVQNQRHCHQKCYQYSYARCSLSVPLFNLFRNWLYYKREGHNDMPVSYKADLSFCSHIAVAAALRVVRRVLGVLCAALIFIMASPVERTNASSVGRLDSTAPVLMMSKAGGRGDQIHGDDAPVVIFDKDFAGRIESESWWGDEGGLSILAPGKGERRDSTDTNRGLSLPSPTLGMEARILARLLVALVVGGIIGMERRAANSLAGVRTFSLVSLGAAVFMSTTLVAFPTADPTRVAAAISSSVGFLGAGAMHKNSKQPRGLTTASSVWLAAALGIAAASGLFLLSFSGAVATVLIARYARFDSSLQLIRGARDQDQDSLDDLEHDVDDITDDTVVDVEDDDIRITENLAARRAFRNVGHNTRESSRSNNRAHWDDDDEASDRIQDRPPRHPFLDE